MEANQHNEPLENSNDANIEHIKNDLHIGLINANNQNSINEGQALSLDNFEPRLNLGAPIVKLVCKAKNHIQFSVVTKNLSESHKLQLRHFTNVKDEEIKLYKDALDQYGSDQLSPEIIEMINKYANSPLAPLIEFELEKFALMKAQVYLLASSDKGEGE